MVRPVRLEHVEGVEARVVRLIALEGAKETEDGNSPRPAAMLSGVLHEQLVSRYDEFLELCGCKRARFVLSALFLGCDVAVEIVGVEDLEHDVEDDHEGEEDATSEEQEHRAKENGPDDQRNYSEELNEGNNNDKAGDGVLRADELGAARLLLAPAEDGDEAAEEGSDQEGEGQDADVIDGDRDASRLI